MRAKLSCLAIAMMVVLLLLMAMPGGVAKASPGQALQMTFTTTITSGGQYRALSLQAGDEVVQFTRSNVVIPAGGASGGFHTIGTATGAMSGDLSGTFSAEWNSIDLPGGHQTIIPGADGFGLIVGKATVDCGGGNTIDVVIAADYDYTVVAPMVIHSIAEGYMVSVGGTGIYANLRLIGEFQQQTSDEDAFPGEETIRGTASLRLYSSSEINHLATTSYSGTTTFGNLRPIPTLQNDMLIAISVPPGTNYVLPANDNTNFEDNSGTAMVNVTAGPFSGATLNNQRNVVTYFSYPTCMGWGVGKFVLADANGTISGVVLTDIGSPTAQRGYMFATCGSAEGSYRGKEYFGEFMNSVGYIDPSTNSVEGTAAFEEMSCSLPPVGGEAYPVNKASLLALWIAVAVALIAGAGVLVLRRRRA